jgi:ATP-dependent Clp protease ATP-binding subunit ClpA
MFKRFTSQSRRAVVFAQEESASLNHHYIGTEHLLLGLLHEGTGAAGRALASQDIALAPARGEVEVIIGRGEQAPSRNIPFTPRSKKCLELSLREALALGHDYIGTGHLLLGLISEGHGVAVTVLDRLGANLDELRDQVILELEAEPEDGGGVAAEPPPVQVLPRPQIRWQSPGALQARLEKLQARLEETDKRLSAIERHLGITRADPAPGEAGEDPEDPGAGGEPGAGGPENVVPPS